MLWITHIAAWVVRSIVVAELLGYLLHRLLHNGWIPWLSKSHMEHHMVLYGPLQKQRPSEKYMDSTTGKIALGNIGLEWIAPSAVILAIVVTGFRLLRVPSSDQAVSVGTILAWSFLMFSYLHDRMHVKNFWMERNSILKAWFRGARRLHDIHHRVLNDRGLMDKNFGIGFFLFDRLFGTLSLEQSPFNPRGYAAARERFKYVEKPRRVQAVGRKQMPLSLDVSKKTRQTKPGDFTNELEGAHEMKKSVSIFLSILMSEHTKKHRITQGGGLQGHVRSRQDVYR